MPKADMKWGETQFDFMDRDELILFAKRAYSALRSADGVLHSMSYCSSDEPYWRSASGTGGRAKAFVESALNSLGEGDEARETGYYTYFRYADQVLFPDIDFPENRKWWINSEGILTCPKPDASTMKTFHHADDFKILTEKDFSKDKVKE